MTRSYSKTLTSYDLLKALAVILMIVDHVGHHFFPDEMWLRILGRLCVPMWFFLIGYARTDKVPRSFLAGGTIITASAIISGQYLFPLDILFTIAILRRMRSAIALRATEGPEKLRAWFLLLLFAAVPTGMVFEYGSMGMLFVLHGFIVRRREVLSGRLSDKHIALFTGFSYMTFGFQQGLMLPSLDGWQGAGLLAGLAGVGMMLHVFRPVEFPDLSRLVMLPGRALLAFTGRHTLFIYVAHILLFRGICMAIYPEKYVFLDWHIAPPGMVYLLMKKGIF